jgi:hypothetical protein
LTSPDERLAVCRGNSKGSDTRRWIAAYLDTAINIKSTDKNRITLYLLQSRRKRTTAKLFDIYIITRQATSKNLEAIELLQCAVWGIHDFTGLCEGQKNWRLSDFW